MEQNDKEDVKREKENEEINKIKKEEIKKEEKRNLEETELKGEVDMDEFVKKEEDSLTVCGFVESPGENLGLRF